MDELRFERQEGERLILKGPEDKVYQVTVTPELRAGVRLAARPPLPEIIPDEIPEDLKPKDIQALVRAGTDPAVLAREAQAETDHVLRYAAPVLDERLYVAEQARQIEVRHQDEASTLEELAIERLSSRGVDPETLEWDSYYIDGGWVARLDFELDGAMRTARWNLDLTGRRLAALDEPAEWITEPSAPDGPVPPPKRHLTAVVAEPSPKLELEPLPLLDEPEPTAIPERDLTAMPTKDPGQLSLLDDLLDARGLREPVSLDPRDESVPLEPAKVFELRRPEQPPAEQAGLDLPPYSAYTLDDANAAPNEPATTERISLRQRAADLSTVPPVEDPRFDTPTPVDGTELAAPADPVEPADPVDQVDPADPLDTNKTPRPNRPRAKRSSVPSWDEIVFGASRNPEE